MCGYHWASYHWARVRVRVSGYHWASYHWARVRVRVRTGHKTTLNEGLRTAEENEHKQMEVGIHCTLG